MKNFVRIFALSLVATGAFAATQVNTPSSHVAKMSAMPTPLCPPNDPKGCGIFGNQK